MAYTDFTLESAEAELGLTTRPADLFAGLTPAIPPSWLPDHLARGTTSAVTSEKARGEFLVAPVLLAVRELSNRPVAILSGVRLDVDPSRRLTGECDFLLTRGAPLPVMRPPLAVVVEAKRHDIEAGLGQCMAQLVAARLFNDRAGVPAGPVWGCVTTGDDWQFLRLEADGVSVGLHPGRLYLAEVGRVLAAFGRAVAGP